MSEPSASASPAEKPAEAPPTEAAKPEEEKKEEAKPAEAVKPEEKKEEVKPTPRKKRKKR